LVATPYKEWTVFGSLASLSRGALLGAFGATLIDSASFAAYGIYRGIGVWRDPNAGGLQKALASVDVILSVLTASALRRQIRSQVAEWANVYSKIPLRAEVQRDLSAIRAQNATTRAPMRFGRTTIYFADSSDVAAGVIDADSFYLTHEAFRRGDDFLMKTIIHENLHLERVRRNVAQVGSAGVGNGVQRRAEKNVVDELTERGFQIGCERRWW